MMTTLNTQAATREEVDASAARERLNLTRIAGVGAVLLVGIVAYIELFLKHH